jgi:hypothetical protein
MVADSSGYKKGALLVMSSGGLADKAATSTDGTIFGVMAETDTSSVSASASLKVFPVSPHQVWKCSTDASSIATAIKVGYTDTVTIVDHNTIDADGSTGGCMMVHESGTDDDGNKIAYVSFQVTNWFGGT